MLEALPVQHIHLPAVHDHEALRLHGARGRAFRSRNRPSSQFLAMLAARLRWELE